MRAARISRLLLVALFLVGWAGPVAAEARSLKEFFRAVGNSIAHPGARKKSRPTPTPPRPAKKKAGTDAAEPNESPAPSPAASPGETRPALPTPSPTPEPPMVRQASHVAATPGLRRDLPYGIPVPNRPGFVTSPYAPKQGLVDVRNFPGGTEVKDPFTGKIFLTP